MATTDRVDQRKDNRETGFKAECKRECERIDDILAQSFAPQKSTETVTTLHYYYIVTFRGKNMPTDFKIKSSAHLLSWTKTRANTTHGVTIGAIIPHSHHRNGWTLGRFAYRLCPPTTLSTAHLKDRPRTVALLHTIASLTLIFTRRAWKQSSFAIRTVVLSRKAVCWCYRVWTRHDTVRCLRGPLAVLFARHASFPCAHFSLLRALYIAFLTKRLTMWAI